MTEITDWDKQWSDHLYSAASLWGIAVPTDDNRPIISEWPKTVITQMLPIVEQFEWTDKTYASRIQLVTLNGQWSYAVSFTVPGYSEGFLPFPKFCKPYASRREALGVAVARVRRRSRGYAALERWLDSLLAPVQLQMFA